MFNWIRKNSYRLAGVTLLLFSASIFASICSNCSIDEISNKASASHQMKSSSAHANHGQDHSCCQVKQVESFDKHCCQMDGIVHTIDSFAIIAEYQFEAKAYVLTQSFPTQIPEWVFVGHQPDHSLALSYGKLLKRNSILLI